MAVCGLVCGPISPRRFGGGLRPRVLVRLAVALCGEQGCARRRLKTVQVAAQEFAPTLNGANHFRQLLGGGIKNSLCELSEINR